MRFWPVSLPVLAVSCCLAATAAATPAKPHYVRAYHGTLTGFVENRGADVDAGAFKLREEWNVTGVVFRFWRAGVFEGGWTASYKVTRGKVSFSATMTGNCSLSASDSFGLVGSLPRPNPSVPLGLDQNPRGELHMLGLIDPDRTIKTTQTCQGSDGSEPRTSPYPVEIPTLFDPGEKNWKPGRRLKGTHVIKTPYDKYDKTSSVQSWSWDLKPGS